MAQLDAHVGERSTAPLFVVGKGRSGTTLVGRILACRPEVALLRELNFFEQVWPPRRDVAQLSRVDAAALSAVLLRRALGQRLGTVPPPLERADRIVSSLADRELTPPALFRAVIFEAARILGACIPCDQTPRNVYFIRDILEHFPDARIVVVIRDPRGVFAAQKDRWKLTTLGAWAVPGAERRRRRVNAHPIAIALQWRAAVLAAEPYFSNESVVVLKFEDLVAHPQMTIRRLCHFLGLAFIEEMLEVPVLDPDHVDSGRRCLDVREAARWRELLNTTEVFLLERVAGRTMRRLGYQPAKARPRLLPMARMLLTFPLHAAAAIALNPAYRHQFRSGRRD
jgi:hypothetical protein